MDSRQIVGDLDTFVLNSASYPVTFPLKRNVNDMSCIPNLHEHVPSTAGLPELDFLSQVERLSQQATNTLDVLINFIQSNDPQLVAKSQLPLAHTILSNLLNVTQIKKGEVRSRAPISSPQPVKYGSPGVLVKSEASSPYSVDDVQLVTNRPFTFIPSSSPEVREHVAKIRRTDGGKESIPAIHLELPQLHQPVFSFQPPSPETVLSPQLSQFQMGMQSGTFPAMRFHQPQIPRSMPMSAPPKPTPPSGYIVNNWNSLPIDWSKSNMKDFELLGELGNGAFGTVRLCKHKTTGILFCVKILDRAKVLYLKQREHILNERTIMFSVNHPFIVKLFCTSKSPAYLFFLMEFVAGGELFNYIRAEGQFNNKTAQLVSAEIILALQYLHNQDIIYRDIKPENLLVDHEGHLKLTDFGFAKHIEDKTKSMCGTLDYMAPEILMAKGHGKPVDWWSLGILIYELLSGCPPFTTDKDCKHAVDVISQGRLEFPSYFDPRAVDLIKRLLTLDPAARLGSHEDAEEIKRHPWFEGIDWAKIVRREHPGPLAELKCFKLHFGRNVADSSTIFDEMSRAGPSKTASFEGFEGFRTIR